MLDYKFEDNKSSRTLVLFHGTGGTKEDLIPIAKMIDSSANILSFEGDVDEAGMKRFFKRKGPGVFDEADLISRTHNLKASLDQIIDEKGLNKNHLIAMGYSNGANIIGSLLYHYESPFKVIFLHHPMMPYSDKEPCKQEGLDVFIGAGKNDPICSNDQTLGVAKVLRDNGAFVDIHWHDSGHQLTQSELSAAKSFFETKR